MTGQRLQLHRSAQLASSMWRDIVFFFMRRAVHACRDMLGPHLHVSGAIGSRAALAGWAEEVGADVSWTALPGPGPAGGGSGSAGPQPAPPAEVVRAPDRQALCRGVASIDCCTTKA